jgi:hypothetical protein
MNIIVVVNYFIKIRHMIPIDLINTLSFNINNILIAKVTFLSTKSLYNNS